MALPAWRSARWRAALLQEEGIAFGPLDQNARKGLDRGAFPEQAVEQIKGTLGRKRI